MKEVVTILSEIDNKSKKIIENADEYKKTLDKESEIALQKFEESSKEELNKKIAALEAESNNEIHKVSEEMDVAIKKQLEALEYNNQHNFDYYVNNVFTNVITM